MPARVVALWNDLQSSLWFIPTLITLAAALLALITARIDATGSLREGPLPLWVFEGGAEGARGVLGAIAGGVITVTGVVFSITIVALQLASTQFTPRVLRGFMADRANQVVLGVFIGTFIYTLLTLRAVRSGTENGEAFVPGLSVAVAILLALISVGVLIFFIDHVARSIQASTIIDQVVRGAHHSIDSLFPKVSDSAGQLGRDLPPAPSASPSPVEATRAGYLTHLDEAALLDLAAERELTIRVEIPIGDFILPGATLASIWPESARDGGAAEIVRGAFIVSRERTASQDLGFQIGQLVDIAVKALSPGINDPKTAEICIDRLAEILVVLGSRGMPETVKTSREGRPLLITPRVTYDHYVALAFEKIRHYGASAPSIAIRLVQVLEQAATLVPAGARGPLVAQAINVVDSSRRRIDDPHDLARLEQAAGWLTGLPSGDYTAPKAA